MSQHNEVAQLRALLERSEREKLALMEQLNRAQTHTSPTTPGLTVSPSNDTASASSNGRPRSSTVSRSATNGHRPQHRPVQQDQSRPMKRSKTTHAAGSAAAAPMMRSRSTVSRPGPTPNPFVGKGSSTLTPLITQRNLPLAIPEALDNHPTQHQFQYPGGSFLPDGLGGREISCDDFLSMRDEDLFPTTSPISIPSSSLLSPHEFDPYSLSSLPSVCGSLTSGPTLETAPMSRCNSSMNDNASIAGQFSEMVRIQSQQSTIGQFRSDNFRPSPTVSHPAMLGKRSSDVSALLTMQSASFPHAYPSSAPAESMLSQHYHPMEASASQSSIRSSSSAELHPEDLCASSLAQHLSMERSVSKDSIKSNASSLSMRAKEALARQNYAAQSRRLQPKPAAGSAKQEPADPASVTAKDGKAAITKTKYERPKHPKVMCNQCNDHPEGFRGEHELRRHYEAKHKSMVKKWICRDPDAFGIPHSEKAVKALKDCKQCSQNKQYGAYYNAAAHLRRTHFKVKVRKGAAGAKNGAGKADEEKEKRGGKGGGDWPSMNELKLWMVEVTVPMDQAGALVPDGTDSVGVLEPEDVEAEFAESQYNTQAGLPIALSAGAYDMAAFAGVGGGFTQTVDLSGASFQGELDSQLSEIYGITGSFSGSQLQGPPIPPPGFDYRNSDLGMQHLQQATPPSLINVDGHSYTSPVSSTATIAQTALFGDKVIPAAVMHAPHDDLADLTFDLTFATASQ